MMHEAPPLFRPDPSLEPRLGDRGLFKELRPLVYMYHAGISPPSLLVKKAVATQLSDVASHGAQAFPRWGAQRERLRGKLAQWIGAAPNEIGLAANTTRGILDIAASMPWRPGDRVVVFRGEFPANVLPWLAQRDTFEIEITELDGMALLTDEAAVLDALERELARGSVRVVAVSAVQFQTGLRTPMAELSRLAHQYGAWLFVDAVQACGMVPLDVRALGIDAMACGSHKWLMGLEGAGFVFVDQARLSELVPRTLGWLSVIEPVDFLFEGEGKLRYDKRAKEDASRFEVGNVSATAFAGLEAALDALIHLGQERIWDHVQALLDAIEGPAALLGYRSLRSSNPERRSGSLCLLPPEGFDVLRVGRFLDAQGIACATPDGRLRLSPHWPNAIDEALQVVHTLERALSQVERP